MNILFLGDVFGKPGRKAIRRLLPRLIDREELALVVANGENATDGSGIDPKSAADLFDAGVHVITSGNHVWRRREVVEYIGREPRLLRPANFPPSVPGRGWVVCVSSYGTPVGILNLIGRVFMDSVDCPFRSAEEVLPVLREKARVVLVDMHAEATSEKVALGWFLAGRVAAVCGTHTHVQTADERVLPGGTAYITDVGMCGPTESVVGVDREAVLRRFLTHMPTKFDVAHGPAALHGAIIDVDPEDGCARGIRRVQAVCPP